MGESPPTLLTERAGGTIDPLTLFMEEVNAQSRAKKKESKDSKPSICTATQCPNCNAKLTSRKCKMVCLQCGYFDDCGIGPA